MPLSTISDPAKLKRLVEAFDDAWLLINEQVPVPPGEHLNAKDHLGEIVVRSLASEPDGPIAELAVALFGAHQGDDRDCQ